MRSKINYQLETDRILAQLPAERTPTLFLHACCAPCSSYVLEYLSRYFAITLFFYNPNISPEAEYLHRKAELCRLVQELPLGNPVTVVDGDYLPERFYALAKGLEQEPERGARCQKCIGHRLEEAFRAAAALEISPDFVCTTLTISPHKDAVFINSPLVKILRTGRKTSDTSRRAIGRTSAAVSTVGWRRNGGKNRRHLARIESLWNSRAALREFLQKTVDKLRRLCYTSP